MSRGNSLFDGRINWRLILVLFLGLDVIVGGILLTFMWSPNALLIEPPPQSTFEVVIQLLSTPTLPATPTRTPTPAQPTPIATPVIAVTPKVIILPSPTASAPNQTFEAMAYLQSLVRRQSLSPTGFVIPTNFKQTDPLVLAHYFAWYDGDGWNDCNISAGDKPLELYDSDDAATIGRHVDMARSVGINGFTMHWFAPNDRTDRNFQTLLQVSQGSDFASTVVFSYHIWHGSTRPTQQNVDEALRYILDRHTIQPNFLRVDGQPVIFFTDVYRTPGNPQQFWAEVRDQVDPQRQTIWIAEGLDASYLSVFDGLYVFKISHAAYPHDYRKSSRWGRQVRQWADRTGQPKLWLGTISPGWDDLRSACRPDVRVENTPHRLDRANGDLYEATFQAAIDSQPDWLIISSFNEWVEGSYIEPSEQYGDLYMTLTANFARRFKGGDN